ncbi:methylated-DNA--[protein]-cysteine S-methyltransferase [Candidatus Latescibacterota bacterium]
MKLLQESPVEFLEPLSKPPETLYAAKVTGSFGSVAVAGTSRGIVTIHMDKSLAIFISELRETWASCIIRDPEPLEPVIHHLKAYLDCVPGAVEAVVQPVMVTPFTLEVHRYLARIPYGTTLTYGEIAAAMNKPLAARAVGGACGRNRTLVIVPCHRVLSSNGLGGFGAGLGLKERLLRHEHITYTHKRSGKQS